MTPFLMHYRQLKQILFQQQDDFFLASFFFKLETSPFFYIAVAFFLITIYATALNKSAIFFPYLALTNLSKAPMLEAYYLTMVY